MSTSDINNLSNNHQPGGIQTVSSIDWNREGTIEKTSAVQSPNLNYISSIQQCPGLDTTLVGFNDWNNLQLNMWQLPITSSMFDGAGEKH